MERQAVTTDKDSGIVNDTNLWATETMGNALFLRVITVSLETMKLVNALPPLGDPSDLRWGADDRVILSTDWFLVLLPRVVLHQSLFTDSMKFLAGDQLAKRLTELVGQFVAPDANRR